MRGKIIDFTDFYKMNSETLANPFMGMKGKKKQKLQADQVSRLHLADSEEESDDFGGSFKSEDVSDAEKSEGKYKAFDLD